ncbi:MAG: hypothetical protein HKL90_09935 [Elusimicrobia bacterium]|nr:hypothetical protein [Elusimicrobiota bacterium]
MNERTRYRRTLKTLAATAFLPAVFLYAAFDACPARAQLDVVPRAAMDEAAAAVRPVFAASPILAPAPLASALTAPALSAAPVSAAAITAAPSAAPALAPAAAAAAPAEDVKPASPGSVAAPAAGRKRHGPPAQAPHDSAREQLGRIVDQGAQFDGGRSADAALTHVSEPSRRLGKKAPVRDPRNLLLSKYAASNLQAPPAQVDFSAKVKNWGMMLNDTLGDCTVAACGHQIQQWTANAGKQVTPPDASILSAYEAVSGYRPGRPSTDNGAEMLTVLKYWRKLGIAGHKIGAFAYIDPTNFDHLRAAVWTFGSAYIGLAMPKSSQKQAVWDVPAGGAVGDGAPGSWGGHAVEVAGFGPKGLLIVTWGELKWMTWDFLKTYCDEAYAIISQDFLAAGKTPNNGFDLAALNADLKAVADVPPPSSQQSRRGPTKKKKSAR